MSLDKLKQRRFHEFPVQDCKVRIRNISEKERDEMVKDLDLSKDATILRQRLVCAVLVSVDGEAVTVTPGDVAEMDFGIVSKIAEEAQAHCGMGGTDSGN